MNSLKGRGDNVLTLGGRTSLHNFSQKETPTTVGPKLRYSKIVHAFARTGQIYRPPSHASFSMTARADELADNPMIMMDEKRPGSIFESSRAGKVVLLKI